VTRFAIGCEIKTNLGGINFVHVEMPYYQLVPENAKDVNTMRSRKSQRTAELEKLTFAVREASVSRYKGGPIKGHP